MSNADATRMTAATIHRFNEAFQRRDRSELAAQVHEQCVMVSTQPAPDGTVFSGKSACVDFWAELMDNPAVTFEVQHVFADGDWAAVRWRFRFGDGPGDSVLGTNLTRVSDGLVIEQLGYTKAGGELPLPAQDPVVVSGHLMVDPAERDAYLDGCRGVVRLARANPACSDFSISPDLLDAGRVNVQECWVSRQALAEFRGEGPNGDQVRAIRSADVREHDVVKSRSLLS